MGLRELFKSKPRAAGTLTADRDRMTISIRKDRLPADLRAALAGTNDGDWGGADYPQINLSDDLCGQIADLVSSQRLKFDN